MKRTFAFRWVQNQLVTGPGNDGGEALDTLEPIERSEPNPVQLAGPTRFPGRSLEATHARETA